jgi:hypothetical protein
MSEQRYQHWTFDDNPYNFLYKTNYKEWYVFTKLTQCAVPVFHLYFRKWLFEHPTTCVILSTLYFYALKFYHNTYWPYKLRAWNGMIEDSYTG